MGMGPVPATKKVLEQAGLSIDQVDAFELNEPFAVQVLTWCEGMGVSPDDERLNPYGGAIACGHPLAATGVRLVAQLAYAMRERPSSRYGLTALCVGMGHGRGAPMGACLEASLAMPTLRGRADLRGAAVKPGSEPKPLTQFKLAQVRRPELERPLALVTIDNGADHTKPTVFGRSAFESLDHVLGELESRDWAALVITGKPYFFSAGADLDEFSRASPELAREGSRTGHELFGRIRGAAVSHGRRDQRGLPRRWRRARAPLRCTRDLDLRFAISPAPNVCSGSFPAGAEPSSSRGSSRPRPRSNSLSRARSARTGCSTAAGRTSSASPTACSSPPSSWTSRSPTPWSS
jgi:hypothetical protein